MSKKEGYRSRAVFKLKEIDEKYKILRNGISLIDLGAAPGGIDKCFCSLSDTV